MIAVDTSALIAILANEPQAPSCRKIFESEDLILVSAGTVLEALIVAARRGMSNQMRAILSAVTVKIIDVTPARAELAATAYTHWGRNFHRASLNFGDCFAYATAKEFNCPLLFIGNDFAQTDIPSAIAASTS
ncbi:type II toxin-antitoxin system VapC family toxin [Rhizobium sp.]|uniref:type II toxin-antitoxin system VapC family toxin n=1 Tax=Rhizobium sp. TaxID=391 RepID=UPI000DBA2872